MKKQNKQRLEQLVRQGLVPSRKLPILMTAMSSLHMGKQLTPTERDILAKYMHNMTDIMLKDDTVFNRTKLHTQRTKYQTEETTVDLEEKMVDGVDVVDGPEAEEKMKSKKAKKKEDIDDMKESKGVDPDAEERMRKKEENKARRLSIKSRQKFRMLPKEIRKEKEKAGLDEELLDLNNMYREQFEAALEHYGIDNIRDLPEESKAEFFNLVDLALEEAKMAKKDHDGDGKVETSTAEYMGSKDKAIKKAIKLKGFGKDSGKSNMSNPAARASLMKKEEVEQVDELEQLDEYGNPASKPAMSDDDRLAMIRRAAERVKSGEAARDREKRAEKAAKADMRAKGAQKGMAPVKKKKSMSEQINVLRKTIQEGTARQKLDAYAELNNLIKEKLKGEL